MIQNMRDLGGIRTVDGRAIRPGMLIRSGQLVQAREEDLRGVSAVIDLRTPVEQREMPDHVCGHEFLSLPLFDDAMAGISHEQETKNQGIPDMAMLYGRLMRECTASFRRVMLAVMTHDYSTGAVLWHCTEGKDRTGMTTALVLEALGVERDAIMEDYLKTNQINIPKAAVIRERLVPTHGEAFAERVYRAYIADEKYLRAAWEAMGKDYLRDTLRIDDDVIRAFRQSVLA